MNLNNRNKGNGTFADVLCAIIFLTFTFIYLYSYQDNILVVGQHVLSNGATSYNRTIGAVLITLFLFFLQMLVRSLIKPMGSGTILMYFPSFLLLTIITDVSKNIDVSFSFGGWLWAVPLLLLLWGGLVWLQKQIFAKSYTSLDNITLLSRGMWIRLLIMLIMMIFTCSFSNNNRMFHYRIEAEHYIMDKKYDEALAVGKKCRDKDSSMTMLRAYALSCKDKMADSLFFYPLCGGSKALIPDGITTKSMLIPSKAIIAHYKMPAYKVDYALMALLLDKDIDSFVRELRKHYPISAHLPRHYREALVLYTHLRSNPQVVFHETVMDTDFQDFTDMQHAKGSKQVKQSNIRDTYGGTYWYYYEYE